MMPEEIDEIVGSLGRELVSDLAPEELPLYPSLLGQFEGAKPGRGKKDSSDDQFLGFGGDEVLTMLTPVILSFTSGFWQALVAETARNRRMTCSSTSGHTSPGTMRPPHRRSRQTS